jgi:hypothetical protein
MEKRNCQNCKTDFTITSEDFSFYEKVKVPPPTFCPQCRSIRRLNWRNQRSLYKRDCGICGKHLISMYAEGSPPVYCTECWNGGDWNPLSHGRDYDFSRPFFTQLKELFQVVPRFYAYRFGNLINSEYTNYSKNQKNVYLSFSVLDSEDILYSEILDQSKNTVDSYTSDELEGCYENIDSDVNYNTHFAIKSRNCIDSWFIYDCANSSCCVLSTNLRSQQYVFRNQKLTKEKYEKAVASLRLDTYDGLQKARKEFDELVEKEAIHKNAFIYASQNATGDHIHNAKNIKYCFDVNDAENVSYAMRVLHSKDCYDCSGCGYAELIYESMAATQNTYMDAFCYITTEGCRLCQYSLVCKNCSNCFGCVGLINKEYCIFNKQYTKEEYEELVPKIKKHMDEMPYIDEQGRVYKYGEFFPFDMCPFGYNEAMVQDFFPLTKKEVLAKGYNWKEPEEKNYNSTIKSEDLPQSIEEVSDQILEEIIACPNRGQHENRCTGAYRIVPAELTFYRQKKLPLPRLCPNCRHHDRLRYRSPMRLYVRKCNCNIKTHSHENSCDNEFETPYAPERIEKIYCESCYNKEVY